MGTFKGKNYVFSLYIYLFSADATMYRNPTSKEETLAKFSEIFSTASQLKTSSNLEFLPGPCRG